MEVLSETLSLRRPKKKKLIWTPINYRILNAEDLTIRRFSNPTS